VSDITSVGGSSEYQRGIVKVKHPLMIVLQLPLQSHPELLEHSRLSQVEEPVWFQR
jgi:hypothetical protein